jgi:hypothetical protein
MSFQNVKIPKTDQTQKPTPKHDQSRVFGCRIRYVVDEKFNFAKNCIKIIRFMFGNFQIISRYVNVCIAQP